MSMKYEDLKCEHCNGRGEREMSVEPFGDSPVGCIFCNGTGIDHDQIALFVIHSILCANCGCALEDHNDEMKCPAFMNGLFYGFHTDRDRVYAPLKSFK